MLTVGRPPEFKTNWEHVKFDWNGLRGAYLGLGLDDAVKKLDEGFSLGEDAGGALVGAGQEELSEGRLKNAIATAPLQMLYQTGGREPSFYGTWFANNAGRWLFDEWKSMATETVWTNKSIVALYKALDTPWYMNLDVASYAPDVSAIVQPLLDRLDDAFVTLGAWWDAYRQDFRASPPRPLDGSHGGSVSACIERCSALRVGVMALVAEYPEAPAGRQLEISNLIVRATQQFYLTGSSTESVGDGGRLG